MGGASRGAQHEDKDQRGDQGERKDKVRPTHPQQVPQKPQGEAASACRRLTMTT